LLLLLLNASGSVLFTTKFMVGADDNGTLPTFSVLQLLFASLFDLLTSSQFLLLSELCWLIPVTQRGFLVPFFQRLEKISFCPSAPTFSWRDDDSSLLVASLLLVAGLFEALPTMTTAVAELPVPVESVAVAGAANWLRSRRPNGLEKQNMNATHDDNSNACFRPVVTRKQTHTWPREAFASKYQITPFPKQQRQICITTSVRVYCKFIYRIPQLEVISYPFHLTNPRQCPLINSSNWVPPSTNALRWFVAHTHKTHLLASLSRNWASSRPR